MVNRKNVEELVKFMNETPDEQFDMSLADRPGCGTPGCIGGHAGKLWEEVGKGGIGAWNDPALAEKLGIGENDCMSLILGGDYLLREIDKPWAIRMLENLAKTGKVDWEGTSLVPSSYKSQTYRKGKIHERV